MKRILYITNRIDGPGGLERVLSIKASMLADSYNYKVFIITLNQKGTQLFYDFSKKITHYNILTRGGRLKYIYTYISQMRVLVKKINPEIIIVCDDGLKGFFVPLFLGKPCPMIYERHVSKLAGLNISDTSILNKMRIYLKFTCMSFGGGFYDYFVVLTHGNLKEWQFKNILVIPNPLSFYPDETSTLRNKKVLAVGKQCYQKGYDRLLKSWKLVNEKHSEWRLDIYGTISKAEALDSLAYTLGISDTVNFYAPVKNISDIYKEASIYAMSSRYEGFGMVLTEAMAHGVPCVAFDCPHGPSDIIDDQLNGILVKPDNIDALAKGINYLIEHETVRFEMGKKSREDVKYYLPEKIVVKWDKLFNSLVSNK